MSFYLPEELLEKYHILDKQIKQRLLEFSKIPKDKYFYELCFCICTPQSKASAAFEVQRKLEELNFYHSDINPTEILFNKEHYIRFHNQKAKRLLRIKEQWPQIKDMLNSPEDPRTKREWLNDNINGIGMKESAHYLRNIGYRGLGILDRHILKHLVNCGVFKDIPKISSKKQYLEVEKKFLNFSKKVGIDMDELDLLFWAFEAGEILK